MVIDIEDHDLPCHTPNTYNVFFFDDIIFTTVTHDPDIVSDWISEIKSVHRRSLIVGHDVEWRPPSPANTKTPSPPSSSASATAASSTSSSTSPTSRNPSSISSPTKISPSLGGAGEEGGGMYDRKELKNAGLKGLSSFVLRRELEKPQRVTMSRWDNRWLTADQVQYACVDAFVSFEIGRILNASDY
ncbi:UNVERIFIED_CONTAM: hypothetical protein Scaly_0627100 [Sesamum calycinum]|uniref:3'-5' exonuclease domain-containing protein n=1 Tax=Sesamum calycinum TaxID=2727403 RepID=A0AAW2RT97_9LAMI